jgi:SAM-dependent methyltransferase
MESVSCNSCGSSAARPVYTLADYLLDKHDAQWTLVQCSQCGLVYQNPRPTPAEIGLHYPPEYDPYQAGVTRRSNSLQRRAAEYGMWKRGRYVTRHKQGGALLDVGCATGTFLAAVRDLGGWQVAGVEINPDVAAIARAEHHLDVFAGTLEEARYPDKTFDAVTLWDVLEHVHDPAATLREIGRILKEDGIVVIRVPNYASWDAALFGRYWAGLDAPRHLYVFTPTTLTRLLHKSGLVVRGHSTGIGGYMVFVLNIRFWLNAHPVPPQIRRLLLAALSHPLARLASAPLFFLPAQIGQGPLLVTTAQKVGTGLTASR